MPRRDRLYLSIGHYAIALYAAMIEAGILPENVLETYGGDDSQMPMSGMAAYTPGMEITGGSLGHGLGIAVGAALGLRKKQGDQLVYNLMSDGELGEGSTWEAAKQLQNDTIDCAVQHVSTIKPLDVQAIREVAAKTGRLVVVAENHTIVGGPGEAVAGELMRSGISAGFRQIGLPDEFLDAGALPTLHDRYGLSVEAVKTQVKNWLAD